MKTEVTMQRELFGETISQRSKSEFFSATDLVKAGNKWRIVNDLPIFNLTTWMRTKSTKEFISELESVYGKVRILSKGKNSHTWIHPFLFIDLALAINPKLKIEVYKWLYDKLLENRNASGDSYNAMTGALYNNSSNPSKFRKEISEHANAIKSACGHVGSWDHANEHQLNLRIEMLSEVIRDNHQIVRLAITKAIQIEQRKSA